MELQRSLDRKKGEEGKGNLKKILSLSTEGLHISPFLSRDGHEYGSDRRHFQTP